MTIKEEAHKLIDSLPDSCNWEDVAYRFYVRQKLEASLQNMEAGRVVGHEQVKREIRAWFKSNGAIADPSTPAKAAQRRGF